MEGREEDGGNIPKVLIACRRRRLSTTRKKKEEEPVFFPPPLSPSLEEIAASPPYNPTFIPPLLFPPSSSSSYNRSRAGFLCQLPPFLLWMDDLRRFLLPREGGGTHYFFSFPPGWFETWVEGRKGAAALISPNLSGERNKSVVVADFNFGWTLLLLYPPGQTLAKLDFQPAMKRVERKEEVVYEQPARREGNRGGRRSGEKC